MSLRPFFAMLFAVAMLFAPLAIQDGGAMATAPAADHHANMREPGHCGDQPSKSQGTQPDDQSCCAAMCTAIAVAPTSLEPHALAASAERPSLTHFHHGFMAELPDTPSASRVKST